MKKFRSNESRAKWTKILLVLCITISVFGLISGYLQLQLLQGWLNGEEVDLFEAELNDTREGIISIAGLIFGLGMTIAFIFWFRRAYFNLHQKLNHLNHSEGWAAGAWFVPFLNLYRPFQIMKELFEESSFYLKMKGITVSNSTLNFVIPWWIFYLISNFVGRIIFRMQGESIEELIDFTQLSLAGGIFDIVYFVFALKLVTDYSEREKVMLEAEKIEELVFVGTPVQDGNLSE